MTLAKIMKIPAAIVFLSISLLQQSYAQRYEFQVHRFCDLQLNTTPGEENIEIKVYPKAVDETKVLFKAKLKKTGDGMFVTGSGITVVLVKLPKEIVNDRNRHINSGRWLITLLGGGKEYLQLKKELTPISTFRHDYEVSPDSKIEDDMSDMSYLGSLKHKEEG